MIETVTFNNKQYPKFQSEGNAARFAIPFAKEVCQGVGYDIGCNRSEWAFPGSLMVDSVFENGYDAMNLPKLNVDYIFSSHCLEHLPDWVGALDYWRSVLKSGGTLFLYLPHPSQEYWLPWNNRKHIHVLHPYLMKEYFKAKGWTKVFVSSNDLNNSFYVVAEKP